MRRWKYLSLRKKVLLCAVVIVLLGALVWSFLDYPALTGEGYLRRAERAHLLPKGDILTEIDTGANGPHFIAADGGKYLELCRLPQSSYLASYEEEVYLYEKKGSLTAVSFPSMFYGVVLQPGYERCCMLLFDERPEVQRVELSFVIDGYTYTSQADREVGGIFLCYYFRGEDLFYDDKVWVDYYLPDIQSCVAKLYDSDGALIEETEVPVANPIA